MPASRPVDMEEARRRLEQIMKNIYQQNMLSAQNCTPFSIGQAVHRPRKQKTPVLSGPPVKKTKPARSRKTGRFSEKSKKLDRLSKDQDEIQATPAMEGPPTPRADPETLADAMVRAPCPLLPSISQEILESMDSPAADDADDAQVLKSEEEEFIDVVGLDEEPPKLASDVDASDRTIPRSDTTLADLKNTSQPAEEDLVIIVDDVPAVPLEDPSLPRSPKIEYDASPTQDTDFPNRFIKKPKSDEPHFFFKNRYRIEKDMERGTATIVLHDRAGRGKKSMCQPTDEAVFIHYLFLSNKTTLPLMLKGAKLDLLQMEEAWDREHEVTEADDEKAFNLWTSLCKQSWGDDFAGQSCGPSESEDGITEDRLLHLIRINASPTAREPLPHVPRLLPAIVRSRQAEGLVLREKSMNY